MDEVGSGQVLLYELIVRVDSGIEFRAGEKESPEIAVLLGGRLGFGYWVS